MAERTVIIVHFHGTGPISVNHETWLPGETHTVTPKQFAALCAEHGAEPFAVQGTLEAIFAPAAVADAETEVTPPAVTVETPKRRGK